MLHITVDAIDDCEYYALEKVCKNKHNIIYIPTSLHSEIFGHHHDHLPLGTWVIHILLKNNKVGGNM